MSRICPAGRVHDLPRRACRPWPRPARRPGPRQRPDRTVPAIAGRVNPQWSVQDNLPELEAGAEGVVGVEGEACAVPVRKALPRDLGDDGRTVVLGDRATTRPRNVVPMMLSCRSTLARPENAVGVQQGQPGAGARAARRAVHLTVGEDRAVALVRARPPSGPPGRRTRSCRRPVQARLGRVPRGPGGVDGVADLPPDRDQLGQVVRGDGQPEIGGPGARRRWRRRRRGRP